MQSSEATDQIVQYIQDQGPGELARKLFNAAGALIASYDSLDTIRAELEALMNMGNMLLISQNPQLKAA